MITALKEGRLDAAILPVQYLDEFHNGEVSVLAATSYLNLVIVENGNSIYSLADLNGRSVLMPESTENSLENNMLSLMLSKANIHVNITYESDEEVTKKAHEGSFEIMALTPAQCAHVLLENDSYRSCFDLADQWFSLWRTQPPAGCLIIARNDVIEAKSSGLKSFLAGVKASVNFINDKHKKAVTLIAESGLGEDTAIMLKEIPHYMYTFLEGNSLSESLEQINILQTATP